MLGSGNIAATISGQNTQSITINANSGTVALGSSAAKTLTLNSNLDVAYSGRASGVQTISVSVGQKTADLSDTNLTFQDMRTVSLSGAGTGATVLLNGLSGSANNMVMTLSGLDGGFSAAISSKKGGDNIFRGNTGKFNVSTRSKGAGNLTAPTGTNGQMSASTVDAVNAFIDQSATAGSASLSINACRRWSDKYLCWVWFRRYTLATVTGLGTFLSCPILVGR